MRAELLKARAGFVGRKNRRYEVTVLTGEQRDGPRHLMGFSVWAWDGPRAHPLRALRAPPDVRLLVAAQETPAPQTPPARSQSPTKKVTHVVQPPSDAQETAMLKAKLAAEEKAQPLESRLLPDFEQSDRILQSRYLVNSRIQKSLPQI